MAWRKPASLASEARLSSSAPFLFLSLPPWTSDRVGQSRICVRQPECCSYREVQPVRRLLLDLLSSRRLKSLRQQARLSRQPVSSLPASPLLFRLEPRPSSPRPTSTETVSFHPQQVREPLPQVRQPQVSPRRLRRQSHHERQPSFRQPTLIERVSRHRHHLRQELQAPEWARQALQVQQRVESAQQASRLRRRRLYKPPIFLL